MRDQFRVMVHVAVGMPQDGPMFRQFYVEAWQEELARQGGALIPGEPDPTAELWGILESGTMVYGISGYADDLRM